MKRLLLTSTITLMACSQTSGGIDPAAWNCQNLIPHIMEMSQGRTPQVLEISNPEYMGGGAGGGFIKCRGFAEWSEGSGMIDYEARISNGGQVILEYRQM